MEITEERKHRVQKQLIGALLVGRELVVIAFCCQLTNVCYIMERKIEGSKVLSLKSCVKV